MTYKVATNEFYSKFRIKMTGKNGSGNYTFYCSGFEIFGDIKLKVTYVIIK